MGRIDRVEESKKGRKEERTVHAKMTLCLISIRRIRSDVDEESGGFLDE